MTVVDMLGGWNKILLRDVKEVRHIYLELDRITYAVEPVE